MEGLRPNLRFREDSEIPVRIPFSYRRQHSGAEFTIKVTLMFILGLVPRLAHDILIAVSPWKKMGDIFKLEL